MKKKNQKRYYCVVCRTHSDGAGLTFDDGTHICYDCAETIHNVMIQWHEEHLDNCQCERCRSQVLDSEEEVSA